MRKSRKMSVKVKKKTVKSKKKKLTKTKSFKKSSKKRSQKKYDTKRNKKNGKKKILMEDIYSILNKVQLGKKEVTFATSIIDAPVVENNILDSELKYKKVEMKTQVVFTLYPDDNIYEDEKKLDFEILDDEIPDIDQIFG